ncbi:MAG TPA: hypothetical protein VFZ64_17300 [Nocardioidaceae bacterium]
MLKRKPKTKTELMREQAEEVMERLAPHVEVARKEAKLRAAEAREKAAPYVHDVKERTAPAVEGAKTKFTSEVLPVITAAVAAASEATEEAREEAKKRGVATAAALKGELEAPPEKKSHKFRNFLLLLGLGGLVAFVAKKMSDREASTAWQSSYTPTPAASTGTTPSYSAPGVAATDETPVGTAAAAAAQAHDEAGAGPDEAAADASEHPHKATTPDNPAEEVKIDEDGSKS